jgi:hypothetical protein
VGFVSTANQYFYALARVLENRIQSAFSLEVISLTLSYMHTFTSFNNWEDRSLMLDLGNEKSYESVLFDLYVSLNHKTLFVVLKPQRKRLITKLYVGDLVKHRHRRSKPTIVEL